MISITNPPLRKAALALARRSAARSSSATSLPLPRSASRLPQNVLKAASVSAPPRRCDFLSIAEENDFFLGRPTSGPAARDGAAGEAGRAREQENELGAFLLPLNAGI